MVWISSKSEVFQVSGGGGGGQKPPLRGVTFDLRCPFSNLNELFKWKVMCEHLVRICWNRRYVNFEGGRSPILGGVTCDLRCPSLNLPELFQSKAICENLVRIGWAFQELLCPQTCKHTNIQTNIQAFKKKIINAIENNKILFRADKNNAELDPWPKINVLTVIRTSMDGCSCSF